MRARTITLEPDEVAALRRMVARIDGSAAAEPMPEPCPRQDLRQAAMVTLAVRRARARFLHPAMLGEPAFDMLLALYVESSDRSGMTAARLVELSGVPQSSGLRWLNYLSSKNLVSKIQHPNDRRATLVQLTEHGMGVLDAMFTAFRYQFGAILGPSGR